MEYLLLFQTFYLVAFELFYLTGSFGGNARS